MSKSTVFLLYGQIIGFASSIFMLIVFFNEAFLQRGVIYIEPNLAVATLEFFVVIAGLAVQGIVMILAATPNKKQSPRRVKETKLQSETERVGYETNNRTAYQ